MAQTCIKMVNYFAENVFQAMENDSIIRTMFCIHIIVLQVPPDNFQLHYMHEQPTNAPIIHSIF
jgi:hypothetical protein